MKKFFKQQWSLLLVVFTTLLFLAGMVVTILSVISRHERLESQRTVILLVDDLEFEINSELFLLSLIAEIRNGEIISEDELVDTSELGEKTVSIEYVDSNDIEKEYSFEIIIIDTEAPAIEGAKDLSTTVGDSIDLLKDIKVTDNSKEEIKATVEGEYDFNQVGEYKLKYIATDSSDNKAEAEFTLKVNEKPAEPSGGGGGGGSWSGGGGYYNSGGGSSNNPSEWESAHIVFWLYNTDWSDGAYLQHTMTPYSYNWYDATTECLLKFGGYYYHIGLRNASCYDYIQAHSGTVGSNVRTVKTDYIYQLFTVAQARSILGE